MKAINILSLIVTIGFLFTSCEEMEREVYSNKDGRYVRFFVQVNSAGELLGTSQLTPGADIVTLYNNKKVQTLLIPVALTSEPLKEEIFVNFSVDTVGPFSGFSITPAGRLSFSGTKLVDTIKIDFLERWDDTETNQIKFTLTSASDPEIQLGIPGNLEKYNSLTVNLAKLTLKYYLQANNMVEINGTAGEFFEFAVEFPDGLFPSDIESFELIGEQISDYSYTLTRMPVIPEDIRVRYRFEVNETLDVEEFTYTTILSLNQLPGYTVFGNNKLTITKPAVTDRVNSVNTASMFYNLSDPLYRTYGENWMDFNNDGSCEWTAFNAFTYPVVVASSHPNAVLFSDKGTPDPSDDIYHHAFRIGFNSPNAGTTTNSFNLKRWFDNESTSSLVSPGFNIAQALEFYPEDGTNTTRGLVKVIPQDLTIGATTSSGGNVYTISIEGEGTYIEISPGIFEVSFELRATNLFLFGGTRSAKYKIYNTNTYNEPPAITEGCFGTKIL